MATRPCNLRTIPRRPKRSAPVRRLKPPASTISLPTNRVTFVKALYPRLREDDANIERLRAAIDLVPPIVVARGHVLVDGFHRWQAFRREGRSSIPAIDLGNITDTEIFNESIRRNAAHGLQLSLRDKEHLTVKLWQTYAHLRNGERVAEIAKLLAVSTKSIERWTKDIRALEKEAQKNTAWDMWLDGGTEQQIANEVQVHQTTVGEWIKEKRQQSEFLDPPESRQHFDVWQFAVPDDDAGTPSFFGKLAPQVIENLLWLYTEPGQVVVDPFAGGGTVGLIQLIRALAKPEMVPNGQPAPKRSDVVGWSSLIANTVAPGQHNDTVRAYLKAIAKSTWDMANWLTHASGARRVDTIFVIDAVHTVLENFGTAVIRHESGGPERCPDCGSYSVETDFDPDLMPNPYISSCAHCGWEHQEEGN